MTTTSTLFRATDAFALKQEPDKKAGSVCWYQQDGDTYIKVWRDKQPAPEFLRLDDIVPWTGDETDESL